MLSAATKTALMIPEAESVPYQAVLLSFRFSRELMIETFFTSY